MNSELDFPHLLGELKKEEKSQEIDRCVVETYGGRIHVEWEPQANVTPIGQLPFFIEFLKQGNLFDRFEQTCPLNFTSPNAPKKRDVLGTILLSILSGHTRYSHISQLQGDRVNPPLLGMKRVVSEDAVRRGLNKLDESQSIEWLEDNLNYCYEPLLREPWILDVDMTVKVIYGKQEGAVVGYNPHKRGRPSHAYHSYMMSPLRLMLNVEVQPGNQHSSKHTAPELWKFLDSLSGEYWPSFLRGDCNFGNETIMKEAEKRNLAYLFKLKCTKNVKRLIQRLTHQLEWDYAGQGWEGAESDLQLQGWSYSRRVIVLRKKMSQEIGVLCEKEQGQQEFIFADVDQKMQVYEYAVLVTSLSDEILTIAQHYRDRADSENCFDELKNQWGWCGFTTHDLKRCKMMAKMIALIYNWWSLFARLANPTKHTEAITSRPLLLNAVALQIQHARQKRISISHHHAKASVVKKSLIRINQFFKTLKQTTEQLSSIHRWYYLLSYVFV
jgi:hypothetical protein